MDLEDATFVDCAAVLDYIAEIDMIHGWNEAVVQKNAIEMEYSPELSEILT